MLGCAVADNSTYGVKNGYFAGETTLFFLTSSEKCIKLGSKKCTFEHCDGSVSKTFTSVVLSD